METLFRSIVVGVDRSPEGFVALDQARRLLEPGGALSALVVCQEHLAVHAGFEAPRLARELHEEAEKTLAQADEKLRATPGGNALLAHGDAAAALLDLAALRHADLLAVGSHSHSRAAGILLGSVASRLLHDAPVPVLVARACDRPETFPARVVVGADGSSASDAARRGGPPARGALRRPARARRAGKRCRACRGPRGVLGARLPPGRGECRAAPLAAGGNRLAPGSLRPQA